MNKAIDIDYSSVGSLPELIALLHEKGVPDNQLWYYVGGYQENKAREKGIPLSGLFELTPFCNLDCKMCYVHLNKDQMNGRKLLTVSEWKDIMAQAHSIGMMNATLTGGECLTYPGFDEIYFFLRSLGIRTSIKTNGILLKEKMDILDKYPPRSVTVSLYGSSNEGYKKVTGHAVFDTVYDTLLRLKNVRYPVYIAVTPSRHMYSDIENTLRLAEKLGFAYQLNILLFPPRAETGRELCDITAEEYINIVKTQMKKNGTRASLPIADGLLPECGKNGKCEYGLKCVAGRSSFTVDWKGCLKGCENLNSMSVSLTDLSFSDAWERVHADALSYPLPLECTGCAYEKVCFSCTAYRSINAPRGHCNQQICNRTMLLVKEGLVKLQ